MNRERQRHRPFEMARIQYGAWDMPGTAMFATINQEPVVNMLSKLKSMERGTSDTDMAALPMLMDTSVGESALFRTVKFQSEEMAKDRSQMKATHQRDMQQEEQLIQNMAVEKKRQIVENSIRMQLHQNVPELRDLELEIQRANTALNVQSAMQQTIQLRTDQMEAERQEAILDRARIRDEQHQEEANLRAKADRYRNQLIQQIKENKQRHRIEHVADVAEGRRQRTHDETQWENDVKADAETRVRNRIALRKSLDDFDAIQRAIREANRVKPVAEVGLLDSMNPNTSSQVRQALQRRADGIEIRATNSDRLGFELNKIKHEKDSREKLILSLQVREAKAKDDEVAYETLLDAKAKKLLVRDELLSQREEQEFYRKQREDFGKLVPWDDTCHGERQQREDAVHEEKMRQLTKNTYAELSAMILENKQRRLDAAEENRLILQNIADVQTHQDHMVTLERMRMLGMEPETVLYAIRAGMLRQTEIAAFNLNRKT